MWRLKLSMFSHTPSCFCFCFGKFAEQKEIYRTKRVSSFADELASFWCLPSYAFAKATDISKLRRNSQVHHIFLWTKSNSLFFLILTNCKRIKCSFRWFLFVSKRCFSLLKCNVLFRRKIKWILVISRTHTPRMQSQAKQKNNVVNHSRCKYKLMSAVTKTIDLTCETQYTNKHVYNNAQQQRALNTQPNESESHNEWDAKRNPQQLLLWSDVVDR